MKNENFITSDFLLTATLLYFGFSIKTVVRSNPKRVNFEFENTQKLHKVKQDLWDNCLTVNPMEFTQKQNLLKQIIYGGLKNEC